MIMGTGMWVLMPVAVALGGDFSDLGVYLLGSNTPLSVNESMLPWLWPLSLMTTIAGALLFFGRGYRVGLIAALTWVGVEAVAAAVPGQPSLLAAGSLVAFLIYSGRGSFEVPGRAA
ncbi:MAG: hypothetical protein QOF11_2688 [Chloroflexota bacterium]|jgi:hypothetical protein|nr:hypothetical protein [Chloroflexota bacterium]